MTTSCKLHSPLYTEWAQRHKILGPQELQARVASLRSEGKTIATLNGSFDLLHAGHLQILYEASLQADVLIVALNTDRSIQGYKGPKRPFVTLEYRLQLMAAIEFVTVVTWFDEADPRQFIQTVRPDVHVNGADWGADCIEAPTVREVGGRLHIVRLVPGLSTSALVQTIVERHP